MDRWMLRDPTAPGTIVQEGKRSVFFSAAGWVVLSQIEIAATTRHKDLRMFRVDGRTLNLRTVCTVESYCTYLFGTTVR
jgi:hypothetical protein